MQKRLFLSLFQILCLLIPCMPISGNRAVVELSKLSVNVRDAQQSSQSLSDVVPRHSSALNGAGFEENLGQSDAQAQYITKSGGATAFLTGHSAVFALPVPDDKGKQVEPQQKLQRQGGLPNEEIPVREYQPVQLDFVGANQNVTLSGEDPLSGVYNYFIGSDSSKWATGVRRFARVRGKEIYPGIDIVYYFNEGEMEYDFVVRAGADASLIQLDFNWADKVSLTANGDLTVEKGKAKLTQRAPIVYQLNDSGERLETPSRYQHDKDGCIRIELGAYNRNQELVIDPRVAMGTYLGGSGTDNGRSIAIGSDGSIFVTGFTDSADFPTQNPYQPVKYGTDVFVTKLTADGSALVFSTFFGGGGTDWGADIALDSNDAVYITGTTASPNFPITAGAPQAAIGGYVDAFVSKIAPSGAGLAYSSFLGGVTMAPYSGGSGAASLGTSVAIFSDGSAVVVGYTYCSDFPTTPGAFQTHQFGIDAFVTKINPMGTALTFSTYLGGDGLFYQHSLVDRAFDVAVHTDGSVYVTGETATPGFPTTPGALKTTWQNLEAFVTRLNPTGTGLIYSTFLGGPDGTYGRAIAVDSTGNAYVTGQAYTNFPTTPNAFQPNDGIRSGGFISEISPDGSTLLYSTYLVSAAIYDIGVKSNGNFAVTGYALSSWFDFPLVQSCYPASGWSDAFVTEFQANGSVAYSMRLGGNGEDNGYGLAFDQAGRVCVVGDSNSNDFPTSAGAFQPTYTNSYPYYQYDSFVAVIGAGSCTCTLEYSAANYTVAENVAGGKVTITVNRTGGCGDPVTVDYTTIANTATAASDYTTKTGTVSFASGEMSKTFDVTILNDNVDETTESFLLQLSNPGAGHVLGQMRTSVVTIEDDDVAGAFEFSNAIYTANENGGALTITVNRIGGSAGAVTVRYSTGNATATSGADYTALSNVTLSFAHGQASKTFTVAILNDALVEGAEPFNLTLSTPSGRSTLGKQSKAVVYVLDDEIQ